MVISIHAPHTGRDFHTYSTGQGRPQFQSTRPIRGATNSVSGLMFTASDFNPRAPYGARPITFYPYTKLKCISIHAPHTGRDHNMHNR